MRRALRPSTPGDFPVAGKVTKGAPRAAALWNPLRGTLRSPCGGAATPSIGLQTQKKTDLPLLLWRQIGLLFSPNLIEETPSIFNPWRGG